MKNVLSAAVSTVTMKLTILLMVSFFILLSCLLKQGERDDQTCLMAVF